VYVQIKFPHVRFRIHLVQRKAIAGSLVGASQEPVTGSFPSLDAGAAQPDTVLSGAAQPGCHTGWTTSWI
jgi:hypothetical protein